MTAVKKNTAWKLSRDTDTRPLTRRRFASMLPASASTMAWPLVLDYFQGERRFFAQAAELSGDPRWETRISKLCNSEKRLAD